MAFARGIKGRRPSFAGIAVALILSCFLVFSFRVSVCAHALSVFARDEGYGEAGMPTANPLTLLYPGLSGLWKRSDVTGQPVPGGQQGEQQEAQAGSSKHAGAGHPSSDPADYIAVGRAVTYLMGLNAGNIKTRLGFDPVLVKGGVGVAAQPFAPTLWSANAEAPPKAVTLGLLHVVLGSTRDYRGHAVHLGAAQWSEAAWVQNKDYRSRELKLGGKKQGRETIKMQVSHALAVCTHMASLIIVGNPCFLQRDPQ